MSFSAILHQNLIKDTHTRAHRVMVQYQPRVLFVNDVYFFNRYVDQKIK